MIGVRGHAVPASLFATIHKGVRPIDQGLTGISDRAIVAPMLMVTLQIPWSVPMAHCSTTVLSFRQYRRLDQARCEEPNRQTLRLPIVRSRRTPSEAADQGPGHHLQHSISYLVSENVINGFESIHIYEEHCEVEPISIQFEASFAASGFPHSLDCHEP